MPPAMSAVIAVTIAIVAIAAGCGRTESSAGNASSSLTTSSLSKAAYVKRANAICAEHRRKRYRAMAAHLRGLPDASAEERILSALRHVYIPTMEAQLTDLRALGAPRGDEGEIEAILTAFDRSVAGAKRLRSASSPASLDRQFEAAGGLARDYGLSECTYG